MEKLVVEELDGQRCQHWSTMVDGHGHLKRVLRNMVNHSSASELMEELTYNV